MNNTQNIINLYKEPNPESCDLIAAWPGIGDVSLIVAQYIKDKLNAEEIGKVEPFEFFDPLGVMVKNNIIEAPHFPESKFYYWQNPDSHRGLILFIGEEQPTSKGYDLASYILEVGQKLKVKRIYTCAAAITRLHHSEQPNVWGVATNQALIDELRMYDVVLRGQLQIAGLNGLFLGVAKERGVEGICLLGEVPMYATRIPNPKAALAILNIMPKILGIDIDLAELAVLAKESDEEMKRLAAEAMSEFIDHYTKPVWEEGEEDDEEDSWE